MLRSWRSGREFYLLARAERMNPSGDNDVTILESLRNNHRSRVVTRDLDRPEIYGLGRRVDDPDGGPIVPLHQGSARQLDRHFGMERGAPDDGRTEEHRLLRLEPPDPHLV